MQRIHSSTEWKARSFCYVVPVPLVPVTRQAARVLRQVKLHRKEPGILSVLVSDIPQTKLPRRRRAHRCCWCEFPRTTLFIIMRASSVCSAWCSIVRIAWHLHDQLGVEIDRILQLIPAVAAQYVDTHHAYVSNALGLHCEFPSSLLYDRLGPCRLNCFEARAVHSKHIDLVLVVAIQRIFEKCGISAGSLGAAKQSVWLFLGGAYHSVGLSFKVVEQVLQNNVVRNVYHYRHALPLSMQWPHQQRTFAQIISESLRHRKSLRVASWFFFMWGHLGSACLQLFGTPEAIESALEFWRAVRSNGCPSLIVIFEAHDEGGHKAIHGLLPWEAFFRGLDRDDISNEALERGVYFEETWERDSLDGREERIQEMRKKIMEHRFIVFSRDVSVSVLGELGAVLSFLRRVSNRRSEDEDSMCEHRDYLWPEEENAGRSELLAQISVLRRADEHHRQEYERMALENQRMAHENNRMARMVADLQRQLREQQWYHVGQRSDAWWGDR